MERRLPLDWPGAGPKINFSIDLRLAILYSILIGWKIWLQYNKNTEIIRVAFNLRCKLVIGLGPGVDVIKRQ